MATYINNINNNNPKCLPSYPTTAFNYPTDLNDYSAPRQPIYSTIVRYFQKAYYSLCLYEMLYDPQGSATFFEEIRNFEKNDLRGFLLYGLSELFPSEPQILESYNDCISVQFDKANYYVPKLVFVSYNCGRSSEAITNFFLKTSYVNSTEKDYLLTEAMKFRGRSSEAPLETFNPYLILKRMKRFCEDATENSMEYMIKNYGYLYEKILFEIQIKDPQLKERFTKILKDTTPTFYFYKDGRENCAVATYYIERENFDTQASEKCRQLGCPEIVAEINKDYVTVVKANEDFISYKVSGDSLDEHRRLYLQNFYRIENNNLIYITSMVSECNSYSAYHFSDLAKENEGYDIETVPALSYSFPIYIKEYENTRNLQKPFEEQYEKKNNIKKHKEDGRYVR